LGTEASHSPLLFVISGPVQRSARSRIQRPQAGLLYKSSKPLSPNGFIGFSQQKPVVVFSIPFQQLFLSVEQHLIEVLQSIAPAVTFGGPLPETTYYLLHVRRIWRLQKCS
jgi:hypothetical protein